MSTCGTMGKKLHPKLVARVKQLLCKNDLSIAMISERTGVSTSQVRNIKSHGRESEFVPKKRHPEQDQFNALFDSDDPEKLLECPPEKPQTKPAKPKPVSDLFADCQPATPKVKQITPQMERAIIVDLRADIATNVIAARHGVPILAVESLAERVYWLALADDRNIVRPFALTPREHYRALGPKLTKDQLKTLKPLIEGANEWFSEILNIDFETADTVRKLVIAHHLKHGKKMPLSPEPPRPEPVDEEVESIVSKLFAEIEAICSDELEPLNELCLEFFGREPEPHTVAAWLSGDNDRGLKMETFEVDGQVMTTEREFRGFFRCFST